MGIAFFLLLPLFNSSIQAQCAYELKLEDSWGDGWNGNTIDVRVGSTTTNYTLSNGNDTTLILNVTTGDTIQLTYYASGLYQSEVSFELFDSQQASIYASGQAPPAGLNLDTTAACPSCIVPNAMALDSNSTSSLSVSWTGTGAGSYTLEWGACGFTPGMGMMATTSNTNYTLTGLNPAECYDVYITADCSGTGNGFSSQGGPFSFNTNQPVLSTFPDTVNFESNSGYFLGSGTNSTWQYGSPSGTVIANAASGNFAWVTNIFGNYNANELSYLTSPYYDFTAETDDFLVSFSLLYDTENNYDESWMEVSISGSAWTKVVDNGTAVNWYNDATNEWWEGTNSGWQTSSIIMDSLAGQDSVQFRMVMQSDGSFQEEGVGFDDFILAPLSCGVPSGFAANAFASDSAGVSWTSTSGFSNIEFGPSGFTQGQGTMIYGVTGTDTITGLMAGTTYDVYIQDSCGVGNLGLWAGPFSFTTQQLTVSTFPYVETFEADNGGWISGGSNSTWEWGTPAGSVITSAGQGMSAWVTNLDGDYNSSENSYVQTLIFDCSSLASDLNYSFLMQFETENNYDEGWVEFSFDGTNWTKLVNAGQAQGWYNDLNNQWWENTDGAWSMRSNVIPGSAGQSFVQVRHVFSSDGSVTREGFGIDSVYAYVPSCPAPGSLMATNIDTASVTLTWDGSVPSTYYVEWGASGFQQGMGTMDTVMTDSLNISGLNYGSEYCFYVAELCGAGDTSTWSGPYCFMTACPPALPGNTYSTAIAFTGNGSFTGSNTGCIADSVSLRSGREVVYEYTASAGATSVDIQTCGSTYDTYLYIVASDQTTVLASNDDACGTQSQILGTSVTPGTTFYIVIEGFSSSSQGNYVLDVVETIPCPAPTNIFVSNSSCTELEITWTGSDSASTYDVEYGAMGFTPGSGTMVSSSDTVELVSGLTPQTSYDFYVRSICPADTSIWTGPFMATTDSGSIASLNAIFTIDTVTSTDAIVLFDATGSVADSIYWDFGDTTGTTGSGVTTSNTYYSNGTYNVIVTAFTACGSVTDTLVVTITTISIEETVLGSFTAYPNPTSGYINVSFEGAAGNTATIELINMQGQVLETVSTDLSNGSREIRLNLASLPKGVYLIKYHDEKSYAMETVILK